MAIAHLLHVLPHHTEDAPKLNARALIFIFHPTHRSGKVKVGHTAPRTD
jgi:hypothetical protein